MSTLRVRVTGAVQGVGFRWFARENARRWNLAGWVRNQSDGSVELAVSGPDDAIDRFLRALGRGPDGARVDAVDSHASEDTLTRPFSILR